MIVVGSSPLARGLHPRPRSPTPGIGIIPARAGFTRPHDGLAALIGDHPRSRGVYREWRPGASRRAGSSPLARGLRRRSTRGSQAHGIIPARAGFTLRRLKASAMMRGSSPLARGLLRESAPGQQRRGIIPARAGFTGRRRRVLPSGRDHPRSRGVYQDEGTEIFREKGIIPARAGFTGEEGEPPVDVGDHPRSRGVYAPGSGCGSWRTGSSPLARGLRGRRRRGGRAGGIIPARTGFTCRLLPVG